MIRRLFLVSLVLSASLARAERVISIVATAEVKGTTEPCGCTSDPLGDLARLATIAKGALLVDAGSLLFDPDAAANRAAQANVKAATLEKFYRERNAEVGLGWGDLVHGESKVQLQRHAVNVKGAFVRAPVVRDVGGVKVGVFGVVDPELLPNVSASPAAPAAVAAVAQLRAQGAQVIVALCGMSRQKARGILKAAPGITVGVVGSQVGDGLEDAETIGDALLVAPADKGQRVAKLELHVQDGAPKFALFATNDARKRRAENLTRHIAFMTSQLDAWQKDPHADPAFVATKKRELNDARATFAQLSQPRGRAAAEQLRDLLARARASHDRARWRGAKRARRDGNANRSAQFCRRAKRAAARAGKRRAHVCRPRGVHEVPQARDRVLGEDGARRRVANAQRRAQTVRLRLHVLSRHRLAAAGAA